MTPQEFRQALASTLEDRRLSRTERRALSSLLADPPATEALRPQYRGLAFDVARSSLSAGADRDVIDWLEEVVRLLLPALGPAQTRVEACFSPGDACPHRLRGLLQSARRTVDICVFTITDDRISEAILRAHERAVSVRIVTDNDKAWDAGSDIQRLSAAGVPVRIDVSQFHMHHKFAIFDSKVLVTGSYNWTRSAAESNEENLVVLEHADLVRPFQAVFDGLWEKFG
jgi:phosphatidylserine/phosphatidylglycerophosphate/cardiolipin synthase-like enzyme